MATKYTKPFALQWSRDEARFIINEATQLNSLLGSTQANVDQVVEFYDRMLGAQANIDELQLDGGPALVQYIKDMLEDQVFDPAASFTVMDTELGATVTMIFNNLPKDGNGNVPGHFVANTATPSAPPLLSDYFTAPQITALQAQLTALISAAQAFIPKN